MEHALSLSFAVDCLTLNIFIHEVHAGMHVKFENTVESIPRGNCIVQMRRTAVVLLLPQVIYIEK